MNFRNISSWCIRNPVGPIVLFVGLMLAGIVSFSRMTVTQNPDIEFPVVIVGVSQPGAAPAEMEKQVTQQIEAAVRGVNGVDEINSSVSEGRSQTVVQLQIGTPVDRAVNDVRNAVAQTRGNLPEGILEPTVQRFDTSGAPIVFTITIPKTVKHQEAARALVKFMLGSEKLLTDFGFGIVKHTVTGDAAQMPPEIKALTSGATAR